MKKTPYVNLQVFGKSRYDVRFTPVENEIQHFINCVENDQEPITGSDHALRVTHVVSHMEHSLKIEEPCTITY